MEYSRNLLDSVKLHLEATQERFGKKKKSQHNSTEMFVNSDWTSFWHFDKKQLFEMIAKLFLGCRSLSLTYHGIFLQAGYLTTEFVFQH